MIGNGHFIRTKNLFIKFKSKNFKVKLIVNNISEILKYKEYLLIYDSPKSNYKTLNKLSNLGIKIICFDWFYKFKPYINISIFPHKRVLSLYKSYVGIKYINIRSELFSLKKKNINNNKILIVLGSGDKRKQTDKISRFLVEQGLEISVVKGKYSELTKSNKKIRIYFNPKNFLKLLNDHEYIITNGGTCLFEANYLGKKIFVLPQTKREEKIAKLFFQNKSILGYGLNDLKNNYSKLFYKDKKTNTIVDGKGIKKIYKIISDQI